MKRYCTDLGMNLLRFTPSGHAVYGDSTVPQHTFTHDASHYAAHDDHGQYQSARRAAEKIRSTRPSTVCPPAYADSYTFCGVHNECAMDGRRCHEVYVPGVRSATGAGDSLGEALDAAREMLTLMLGDMQARGDPMPAAMSLGDVETYARAREREPVAGFTVEFRGLVAVETLPHCRVPELTEAEEEMVQNGIREVWRDENDGSECG
jgi:predicted RNase H-like HicB family nuclease